MIEIIFKHTDFYIVMKPAGVNVHNEGEELGFHNQLKEELNEKELFLVHRLDKVTSGLLIIARNHEAASTFGELFQKHKIQKTYLSEKTGNRRRVDFNVRNCFCRPGTWL